MSDTYYVVVRNGVYLADIGSGSVWTHGLHEAMKLGRVDAHSIAHDLGGEPQKVTLITEDVGLHWNMGSGLHLLRESNTTVAWVQPADDGTFTSGLRGDLDGTPYPTLAEAKAAAVAAVKATWT